MLFDITLIGKFMPRNLFFSYFNFRRLKSEIKDHYLKVMSCGFLLFCILWCRKVIFYDYVNLISQSNEAFQLELIKVYSFFIQTVSKPCDLLIKWWNISICHVGEGFPRVIILFWVGGGAQGLNLTYFCELY